MELPEQQFELPPEEERKIKIPEHWKNLTPKQLEVAKQLVLGHRKLGRWPTKPEMAKTLKRSKMSIQQSLEQLVKHKYVQQVGKIKRGVPPRYIVHGFKVMILLDD